MAHPRYVGLRLSTTAGAVPTAADIGETLRQRPDPLLMHFL